MGHIDFNIIGAPRMLGGLAVTDFDADGAHRPMRIRIIEPKDDLILRVIVRDGIRFCDTLARAVA